MKIGFIGGAFDPITTSHLRLATELVRKPFRGLLDQVWFLPCYQSYYGKKMASPSDRLKMSQLAVEETKNLNVKVCNYEIKYKSTGPPDQIWKELMEAYNPKNQHQFHFIIGMDNAQKIHQWSNPNIILNLIPFIVIPRLGSTIIHNQSQWYNNPPHQVFSSFQPDQVSSTQVRKEIKEQNTSELVTSSVLKYIKTHRLYRD